MLDIVKLERVIDEYKKTKDNNIRNEAFILVMPTIIHAVSTAMANFKYKMSEGEKLSLAFDCFLWCLKRVKKEISLKTHFYVYSIFYSERFIIKELKLQNRHIEFIEEVHGTDKSVIQPYSVLRALHNIYDSLEYPYNIIFEDAIISLTTGTKASRVSDIPSMSEHKYRVLKTEFKEIISEILDPTD